MPITVCETKGMKYFTFRNKTQDTNERWLKMTIILVTLPYFCANSGIFCQYLFCTVPTSVESLPCPGIDRKSRSAPQLKKMQMNSD